MRGSDYAELRAFVAVAEKRNFGRAAADLGLVPSSISQMVRTLEARLGVRLLNRTTRKVSLTDAGERLLARVRPALFELTAAVDDLNEFRDTPTGTLRLTVSTIAAQIVLAPALAGFIAAYPAISLDITVDNSLSDIAGGRFDAGIRVGRRVARDMETVKVSAPTRLIAVASPDYLARHGMPAMPADLRGHPCIGLRSDNHMLAWEFAKGRNEVEISVPAAVVVNSMDLMVRLALEGVGIGYTIETFVAEHLASGRLVPLLRDWSPARHSYYLYYSGRGELPVPLKALIAYFGKEEG